MQRRARSSVVVPVRVVLAGLVGVGGGAGVFGCSDGAVEPTAGALNPAFTGVPQAAPAASGMRVGPRTGSPTMRDPFLQDPFAPPVEPAPLAPDDEGPDPLPADPFAPVPPEDAPGDDGEPFGDGPDEGPDEGAPPAGVVPPKGVNL